MQLKFYPRGNKCARLARSAGGSFDGSTIPFFASLIYLSCLQKLRSRVMKRLASSAIVSTPLLFPRIGIVTLSSHPMCTHLISPPFIFAGPFSHRALLNLEEKHVPYTKTLVDLDNKPQWLLDVNPAGSVPVLKDLATGTWTPDSGVIADMLEERFPEPKLGTVEASPQVGGSVFGAFKEFAKASDEDKAAKEAALLSALDEVETYLKAHGGPYVGGAEPCATDVSLMPKLYHLVVALDHFRGWQLPEKYTAIRTYMDSFMQRDSWKNTYYSPELVIKGWVRHGVEVRK